MISTITQNQTYQNWTKIHAKNIGKYRIMILKDWEHNYRDARLVIQYRDNGAYEYSSDIHVEADYKRIDSVAALHTFLNKKFDYEEANRVNLSLIPKELLHSERSQREVIIIYDENNVIHQVIVNRTNEDLVRHFNAFRYGKPKILPYYLNPDEIVIYNGEVRQFDDYWDGTGTGLLHDYDFYRRVRAAVESEGLRIVFFHEYGSGWSRICEGTDKEVPFNPFDPKSPIHKYIAVDTLSSAFNTAVDQKQKEIEALIRVFEQQITDLELLNPNELKLIALRIYLRQLKGNLKYIHEIR